MQLKKSDYMVIVFHFKILNFIHLFSVIYLIFHQTTVYSKLYVSKGVNGTSYLLNTSVYKTVLFHFVFI